MDAVQHRIQYPKIMSKYTDTAAGDSFAINGSADNNSDDLVSTSPQTARKRKQSAKRHAFVDVCLLGLNESVGDIEILLELPTYMQTAICTQRCEILVLELKHFERLFKRHQRTVEMMKDNLVLRLQSRLSPRLQQSVPLLRVLLEQAIEYRTQKQLQSQARSQTASLDRQKSSRSSSGQNGRSVSGLFESFVPSHGALIDIYGPGTVFHMIRQRENARLARLKKRGLSYTTPTLNITAATIVEQSSAAGMKLLRMGRRVHEERRRLREENAKQQPPSDASHSNNSREDPELEVDALTSDPVLRNLEERMKEWLSGSGTDGTEGTATVGGQRYQPRCAKLHRTQTDVDDVKLGAKVVLRPRQIPVEEPPPPELFMEEEDPDPVLSQGNAWV